MQVKYGTSSEQLNGNGSSKTTRTVDNPQVHEGELTTGAVTSSSVGAAERNPATEVEKVLSVALAPQQ